MATAPTVIPFDGLLEKHTYSYATPLAEWPREDLWALMDHIARELANRGDYGF